jgi:hypothetical protein
MQRVREELIGLWTPVAEARGLLERSLGMASPDDRGDPTREGRTGELPTSVERVSRAA